MRTTTPAFALLALLTLTAPALHAGDIKYALEFGLAVPTSDLKDIVDSNTGLGLGFQMLIPVVGGHVFRPRLDVLGFSGDSTYFSTARGIASARQKVTEVSLGLDYLYFFKGGMRNGAYLLAGAGVSDNTVSAAPFGIGLSEQSQDSTKGYFALGGGYQFNRHWGLEARYNGTLGQAINNSYDNLNLSSYNVMGSYRF